VTTWRDYQGILLVTLALLLGGGVAAVAYQRDAAGPPAAEVARGPAAVPTDAPAPLTLGDRAAGRLTFRATCQECHVQGRQSLPPAARERVALVQARVREGVGQMPAFPPSRLSDADLRDLLAYLATPAEPEPPPPSEPHGRGVQFEVLEATGQPGQPPVVRFRIRDDAGAAIAPGEMAALALTVAGPTVDYQWARREDARRAESLPDGSARYAFTQLLPADAHGTFAVATEGALLNPPASEGARPIRDVGYNVVSYFAVTDPAPVLPRTVVRTETCNVCHGTLATHGGTRRNTEFCVMCHNSAQTDAEKRATAGGPMPPESVLFRNFIHRIHTGEDLDHQPFIVYGGAPDNPQPVELSAVHPFPKDRANCTTCHEPETFAISRALEQKSPMTVAVGDQVIRQVPPITAACTGCHDAPRTLAHAATQTAANGDEACATCHGPGQPYSVSTAHRPVPSR
jgi:mono/diheme cytochrome c family protein